MTDKYRQAAEAVYQAVYRDVDLEIRDAVIGRIEQAIRDTLRPQRVWSIVSDDEPEIGETYRSKGACDEWIAEANFPHEDNVRSKAFDVIEVDET